jgi:hypothetical protein
MEATHASTDSAFLHVEYRDLTEASVNKFMNLNSVIFPVNYARAFHKSMVGHPDHLFKLGTLQ